MEAIQQDIHWLGFDWGDRFFYGSDYFEKDYEYAVELIKKGLAYVCELTPEEFKAIPRRHWHPRHAPPTGTGPSRRTCDLFDRMRAGEFEEGQMTLRAKIDLASGNFNMRDPVIYRIRYHAPPPPGRPSGASIPCTTLPTPSRTLWRASPTPSAPWSSRTTGPCTTGWSSNVSIPYHKPRQIEFARLGIDHTVMSKRKLRQLVEERLCLRLGRSPYAHPVRPAPPGLHPRAPSAISASASAWPSLPNTVEYAFLEHCLREDLNETAQRVMAVLQPGEAHHHQLPRGAERDLHRGEQPQPTPSDGTREITFSRHLWIEAEDFLADARAQVQAPVSRRPRVPPEGCLSDQVHRLRQGRKRQRSPRSCATYDPDSRGGDPADGRKVKGATIHWVDADNCVDAEVRLYDNLFSDRTSPTPPDKDFLDCLNPDSLEVLDGLQGGAGHGGRGPRLRPGGKPHRHQRPHLPVHAHGLFLHGQPGLHGGSPGVQPQRVA